MKVVMFGNKGYIGTYLTKELTSKGYRVLGIDKDDQYTDHVVKESDIVVNLVGLPRIHYCEQYKKEAMDTNVWFHHKICKWCIEYDKPLLFTSSVEVFGNNGQINDKSNYNPINFYGLTKVMAEYLTKQVPRYAIVRLSHVFGRVDHHTSRLIPQILTNKTPTIYNSAEKTFDFVHVDKACNYLSMKIENLHKCKELLYNEINLVSGKSVSIQEILDLLNKDYIIKRDVFRKKIEISYQEFLSGIDRDASIINHIQDGEYFDERD